MNEPTIEQPTDDDLQNGIILKKSFPDGREAHLYQLIFVWRICIGEKGKLTYHDSW